jgi:hypothetical protein
MEAKGMGRRNEETKWVGRSRYWIQGFGEGEGDVREHGFAIPRVYV